MDDFPLTNHKFPYLFIFRELNVDKWGSLLIVNLDESDFRKLETFDRLTQQTGVANEIIVMKNFILKTAFRLI